MRASLKKKKNHPKNKLHSNLKKKQLSNLYHFTNPVIGNDVTKLFNFFNKIKIELKINSFLQLASYFEKYIKVW